MYYFFPEGNQKSIVFFSKEQIATNEYVRINYKGNLKLCDIHLSHFHPESVKKGILKIM